MLSILCFVPAMGQLAYAKKYSTYINGRSVSFYEKRRIIFNHYKKVVKRGWWKRASKRARLVGLSWAASRAKIRLNVICTKDGRYKHKLEWDSKYIYWGIKWYYKQLKKKKKKVVPPKCPECPKCNKASCCGSKCNVKVVVNNKITVVNKIVIRKKKPKPKKVKKSYFDNGSRFVIGGYYLEHGLNGCSFSRGGGVIADLKLLKQWDTTVGRLELRLGGGSSQFSIGKGFNAFGGNLNLLVGETYGQAIRIQVLGGLSGDFLYANGKYDESRIKLVEGAVKAMLMGRIDTALVSGEARVAMGVGGHNLDRKYTMLRMEGMLQGELHLLGWLDLIAAGGIRIDQLYTRTSDTYNLLLFGRGSLNARVWRGIMATVGIEAGKYYNYWNISYIMPYVGLGYRL